MKQKKIILIILRIKRSIDLHVVGSVFISEVAVVDTLAQKLNADVDTENTKFVRKLDKLYCALDF